MKKGESIQFLDYTIKNSLNNDGIVLMKEKGESYESHLGNYATKESAQQAAIIYFMLARPEHFATTLYYRAMGDGGQYLEYFLFKKVLQLEGIKMPGEITAGDGINALVYFKGKPIQFKNREA